MTDAESPPSPSSPTAQAKELLHLDDHQLPMAGVFFASIIFLISVTSQGGPGKGSGYFVYGIILAAIAMLCSLMALGFSQKPELVQDKPDVPRQLNHFLFLWNFIGACMMTFGSGPFVITSNGYFSVWAMAIFAVYGIGIAFVTEARNAGSMMAHLAASIVVIIALASGNGSFKSFKGESIYGMIVACISAALMTYQIRSARDGGGSDGGGIDKKGWFAIMAVMAIMWIVSASLMTFRGPFIRTSNGYFGSWGGAITAVLIAMSYKNAD